MDNDFLFGRNAELIIGEKVKSTNGPIEPVNARSYGKTDDGQFRIKFKIVKGDDDKSNKSTISIYNINKDSLSYLEKENLVIFLRVGYGEQLATIFFGDIVRFNSKREGADIVTTLECGDSELTIKNTNVQIGLAENVTNRQIFMMAAEKLKVAFGFIEQLPEVKYLNGFSYSGPVASLLNQLCKQVNFKWTIQDGELLLLSEKKTDQATAVFLNHETGLLGYPTKTEKGVEFDALLNPNIRPGRAVVVESSRFMKGQGQTVKINKATYEGDTHGDKWTIHCEGTIV